MVEDRVRDGRRIAQLLASELTGLSTGPLADVAVVDADSDATPPAESDGEGARAYDVEFENRRVATVCITNDAARVVFEDDAKDENGESEENGESDENGKNEVEVVAHVPAVDGVPDLSIETREGATVLVVESGAAVKRAVDVVSDAIE